MKRTSIWSLVFFMVFALLMVSMSNTTTAADTRALKRKLSGLIDGSGKASAKVKQFAKTVLLQQIDNSVFVSAVKAQNARGISMNEINRIDDEWKNAEDELPIHDTMMSGACADEVRRLAGQYAAIGETFVTDNQGANVCQNELTGDYWQGDEAKWKNSFNNGNGGIDVGTEKLDESTNMVLQQLSLPIADKSGKVIGAITFGIKTGRL